MSGPIESSAEDGVAEAAARVDHVVIPAPDLGAADVSIGDQVGEDPLGRPFGDADPVGDVTRARPGVVRDAEEHVRVVGEEVPRAGGPTLLGFLYGLSMDYEVFMLSRMREAYDGTGSTDKAIELGLARTGKLVTRSSCSRSASRPESSSTRPSSAPCSCRH